MNDQLIAQLNKLRSETPDRTWMISNRESLLSQIEMNDYSIADRFGLKSSLYFNYLIHVPAKVALVLFLLVIGFGSSFMVKASLPGDAFYPGRVIIEKVELMLATTPAKEAEVYNKHAQQKLADLKKLQASGSNNNIAGTVKRLEKDLVAAATSLDIAQAENVDSLDKLAVDINDNAADAKDFIDQTKQEFIAEESLAVMNQVLATTQNVEDKTLLLLVSMYGQDKISAQETADKFVTIIDNQLTTVSNKVQALEQVVETSLLEIDWTITYTNIREAYQVLTDAKANLQAGDYTAVFKELTKAKTIIKNIENTISNIEVAE